MYVPSLISKRLLYLYTHTHTWHTSDAIANQLVICRNRPSFGCQLRGRQFPRYLSSSFEQSRGVDSLLTHSEAESNSSPLASQDVGTQNT
jgi:hypothetical protein